MMRRTSCTPACGAHVQAGARRAALSMAASMCWQAQARPACTQGGQPHWRP
ncbi:hypothetical protein I6B53_04745 [Schaalia sp. 19OD2882]|uniref:hypothetical protein n=1 Tax=Schaalia sp. 19OD2882 TaxID=2794089 RepID=UPI001C1EB501|nr:hypothetical protein [Schaalia sp. 19OD2882]QWW20392.1 hypothetical protein I6B53_04745 [Schaalia sp. 19OD2882]